MRLIAKVIRISHAKFRCSRLTTVQDSQDYASLIFFGTQCSLHVTCFFLCVAMHGAVIAPHVVLVAASLVGWWLVGCHAEWRMYRIKKARLIRC